MNRASATCGVCGANLTKCTCGWYGCKSEPEALEAQCHGHEFACPWCGTTCTSDN